MRRILAITAVVTCALMGLSGCGGDDDGGSTDSGCKSNDDPAKIIKVRFEDDKVTPSGDRVEVKTCQKVEFVVAADDSGEIHIHSDPEQELAYEKGEKKFDVAFDKPGVIVVESHTLDQVIVQLEVK